MSANLDAIHSLLEKVLTTPRALTTQVLEHVLSAHEVVEDRVLDWLRSDLEELETYEVELLLSPLFTPSFDERVRFEAALGHGCVDAAEVDEVIELASAAEWRMTLEHEDERLEAALPRVVIERFVRLLRLDAVLPDGAVDEFAPLPADVRCHLRDRAWARPASGRLAADLLAAGRSVGGDIAGSIGFLTEFVRAHRPVSIDDCVRFLDNVAKAYEVDLEKHRSGERSFFDAQLHSEHRGKWAVAADIVDEHERSIALARALRCALTAGRGC